MASKSPYLLGQDYPCVTNFPKQQKVYLSGKRQALSPIYVSFTGADTKEKLQYPPLNKSCFYYLIPSLQV